MTHRKTKIVCHGDSLTEGYGIPKGKEWPWLLGQEMNEEVLNTGISGDTTSGMLARFNYMVIEQEPTHVIITGGTNDLSLNLNNEQIISNILAMTRHAKYNDIVAIIGIPTSYFPPGSEDIENLFIDSGFLKKKIESYQKVLRNFAIGDELDFIDFSKDMTSDFFLEDGLHPNEKGHHQMMKRAMSIIEKLI